MPIIFWHTEHIVITTATMSPSITLVIYFTLVGYPCCNFKLHCINIIIMQVYITLLGQLGDLCMGCTQPISHFNKWCHQYSCLLIRMVIPHSSVVLSDIFPHITLVYLCHSICSVLCGVRVCIYHCLKIDDTCISYITLECGMINFYHASKIYNIYFRRAVGSKTPPAACVRSTWNGAPHGACHK